jgi:FMNH2-dependent dimethyl sulfone monooxygenase
MSIQEYSVSNRGLRSGLVGTPDQVAAGIAELEEAGIDLLLLQCSPQLEEMERFAAPVIRESNRQNEGTKNASPARTSVL